MHCLILFDLTTPNNFDADAIIRPALLKYQYAVCPYNEWVQLCSKLDPDST